MSDEEAGDPGVKDVQYLFEGTIDFAKVVVNLLKSVSLRKARVSIRITDSSLKFICHENKWLRSMATIERDLFSSFVFNCEDECISFDVNADQLIDCVTLFGGSQYSVCTLRLCYPGSNGSFVIFMEESGVFSECELATFQDENDLEDFEESSDVVNTVMFESHLLKQLWPEMDATSTILKISMDSERFSLSANCMKIQVSGDSDAILKFESKKSKDLAYNMRLLQATQKALNLSDRTVIRMYSNDIINISFYVKVENVECFIEFCGKPLEGFDGDSVIE